MKRVVISSEVSNSSQDITFDDLPNYANWLFGNKRNKKLYILVGTFIGFDGDQYVALCTDNMFGDKSYMKFKNFQTSYYPVIERQSLNTEEV